MSLCKLAKIREWTDVFPRWIRLQEQTEMAIDEDEFETANSRVGLSPEHFVQASFAQKNELPALDIPGADEETNPYQYHQVIVENSQDTTSSSRSDLESSKSDIEVEYRSQSSTPIFTYTFFKSPASKQVPKNLHTL